MTLLRILQTEAKEIWGVCKELGRTVFLLINFLRCSHRLLFPNPWRRAQEQRLQNTLTYMPALYVARKGGELGRNTTRLKLWRYTDVELNQLASEVSRMCRTCYARRTIYVMGGCDCNLRDLMRRMQEVCKRDGLTATIAVRRTPRPLPTWAGLVALDDNDAYVEFSLSKNAEGGHNCQSVRLKGRPTLIVDEEKGTYVQSIEFPSMDFNTESPEAMEVVIDVVPRTQNHTLYTEQLYRGMVERGVSVPVFKDGKQIGVASELHFRDSEFQAGKTEVVAKVRIGV